MSRTFIKDLPLDEELTGYFLVVHKEVRHKKNGEPYLALWLAGKTGQIEAKMWDNVADVMDTFDRDDFIKARGRVQIYQQRPQFTIFQMRRADESEVNPDDFIPVAPRDSETMFAELREIIRSIGNPHLKRLLEVIFEDEQIATKFRRAPAGKTVHHAYLGGLLEHVLSLCRLSEMMVRHYRFIDRDLMLAGAILHDIGKIDELSYQRSFHYTDEGQLLGHIIIGIQIVEDKLRQVPEFPPRLRTLLEHMIISHQGEFEYGSPKLPAFPEALLLHYLDNLDSKMNNLEYFLRGDSPAEGNWTAYNSPLDRRLLLKERYLEGQGAEEWEEEPHPAARTEPVQKTGLLEETPRPASGLSRPVGSPESPSRPAPGLPGTRPAAPAAPGKRPGPPMQSTLFGEKLRAALEKDST